MARYAIPFGKNFDRLIPHKVKRDSGMMFGVKQDFYSCEPGSPEDWIFLKLFV